MQKIEEKIEQVKKMKDPVVVVKPNTLLHLECMRLEFPIKTNKWMSDDTFVILDNAENCFPINA